MGEQSHDFTAWAEFRHRVRKILGREERFAREAGLSPRQHEVLAVLCGSRRAPAPTASELAERTSLSRGTVTRVVNALERRGLVTRHIVRRASGPDTAVAPTAQARRLIESAALCHETALQEDGHRLLESLSALVTPPPDHHRDAPHRRRRRATPS